MMPIEMKSKISNSFINFIENNKSNNYVSNINPNIPLKEQNIRKETKEMLGIIYRDYLCNEEERINFLHEEKRELTNLEVEKREIYNPNNIFMKQKEISDKTEELQIIIPNEKLHIKILNFIKRLFKIK